jgi:deoxycytidylate deaminase
MIKQINTEKKSEKLNMLFDMAKHVDEFGIKGVKITAAIFDRNTLISTGFAHGKTHTFAARFSKSYTNPRNNIFFVDQDSFCFHAETHAIYNAIKTVGADALRKMNSTLYVARAKKNSSRERKFIWGSSKPCVGCMRAAREYNIREIVYTEDEAVYDSRVVCTMDV